jgi:hypothetical protein
VLNVNGMLLLAGGAILSEPSIRVLKMWGIKNLKVVGGEAAAPPGEPAGAADPVALEEAGRLLSLRFKHVGDDLPVARVLKQLAHERLAQRLAAVKAKRPT